jgi:hypothetical protein
MRKGWVIGIAALVAVGGGGYFAADHFANAKVREQAQIFARDMRKVTKEFRYGAVRADLLAQSIVMTDVEFVTLDGDRIKAASVTRELRKCRTAVRVVLRGFPLTSSRQAVRK